MNLKEKEINDAERKIIVYLWKKCKPLREIGETMEGKHSSDQRVINSFKETGNFFIEASF